MEAVTLVTELAIDSVFEMVEFSDRVRRFLLSGLFRLGERLLVILTGEKETL